ncbi:hypothetical protein [Salinibacillus xinjiangensis]|uniref:Uncharacterized protein n=1 Tax=Salinibacillus xinjiangensis TaxID=1229268 RepID=A0A6G1X7W1_9BACI|nr:hypothetical protein [Salinibacillus xinjiangensis]MRG87019.1 hypothetical protein [Salinibacillus xinjiangensis]
MTNKKRNFEEEFEKALQFLEQNQEDYLNIIEKITDNYIQSNANYSTNTYVNFQVHFFELLGVHANVILHYLKQDKPFNYNGQYTRAFRRIEKVRKISYFHLSQVDQVVVNPNKIKGTLFSYNEVHPWEMTMVALRQDGSSFNIAMDINDSMNMTSQLLDNIRGKLTNGSNNIDTNQYDNLINSFEEFKQSMNDAIEKINKEQE